MGILTLNRVLFVLGSPLVPLAAYFCALRFKEIRARKQILELLLLAGFAAAFTAVLTYPISLHPSDHVVGVFDSRPLAFVQAWDVHSLKHLSQLFDANIFFPARNTLAFSENLLGNLPIFAPVYWATNNPIFAYNMVTLATFFLSALTMYWLVRRMTGNLWAAAVASFICAFAPARIFQMERFHVISEQWTPLVVLFAYSYLESGSQVALIASAGFLYLQILTSLHAGIFSLLIGFIYVATFTILRRKHMAWRRMAWLVIALIVVGVALMPIAKHYIQPQQIGANSDYIDPHAYSATFGSYLNGGENHFYHHLLLRFVAAQWNHEKQLFFGLLPWTMALIAVAAYLIPFGRVKAVSGKPEEPNPPTRVLAIASTVTVLVGFVLSLGPYIEWHHQVSRISLPYLWLSKILPGFSLMRVPARFAFVTLFGVAILGGLGFQAVLESLRTRSSERFAAKATAVTATVIWILLWEFCQAPLPFVHLGSPLRGHGEYAWLAAQRPDSATVELPTSAGDLRFRPFSQVLREIDYMYASTYHWQPLVNGISSHYPNIFYETTSLAVRLPDPGAALALRRLGVRFIVVHMEKLSAAERALWEQLPAGTELVKAATIDQAIIYSLKSTEAWSD